MNKQFVILRNISDEGSRKSSKFPTGFFPLTSLGVRMTLAFIIFITSLFHLIPVRAQSLSLSISPPLLEVFIKPGKSITQTYKITNNSESVVITVKLQELTGTGIAENPKFVPEKWITLLNSDIALGKPFLLPANQTKQIILRVNPPPDATETDYYRALVISTQPATAGESSQSMIVQNLVSPLLITVTNTGLIPKGAQISKFDLPQVLDSFGPLTLDIEIQNTGKIYFRPIGKITLQGLLGNAGYPISPNVILTKQSKIIFTQNSQIKEKGPQHTLMLAGFFLGKYEVGIDVALDESTTRLTQKKTFYALPIKAGAGISVIILLLSFWSRKVRRAFR